MPAQNFGARYALAAAAVSATAIAVVGLALLLPAGAYPWIKALHIIAVIAWMAGMLYLPRLFVYHCATEKGSVQSETFKVMERRLLRGIINPAMIATWVFGLWLGWSGHWLSAPWLQAKLALVVVLSAMHGLFARWVKAFAADQNQHSQKFYRIINEVPTIVMIAVVILVVLKPF
jgi:protoporphyrinogen IX oxidase